MQKCSVFMKIRLRNCYFNCVPFTHLNQEETTSGGGGGGPPYKSDRDDRLLRG